MRVSNFSATSSTVYTATFTPTTYGAATIDVASGAFTDGTYDNIAVTQFTWTYSTIATPLTKTDVAGSSRAINAATTRFSQFSIKMANKRMQWLNRNRGAPNKSRQGIQFSFSDPLLQEFFNGSSKRASEIQLADAASAIRRFANNTDLIMSDVQDTVTELALAELREGLGTVNLNPVGGTVYKDWSLWTEGEISVGKIRESGDSAEQKTKGFAVTVGVDRPYREDHRVGASFSFGKDDIDVGTSGSAVDSDNYSLSFYSAMQYPDLPRIEGVMGLGYMNIDTLRIDGSESLTGDRKAHALFGSVAVHKEPLIRGKYTISPYGRMELVYTELDDYAEIGGSLALTYDQQEITSTMVFVGTQIEYAGFTPNGRITPFGAIEYGLDLSSSSDAAMRYTTESTSYSLSQDKLAASHWMVKFGADYLMHSGSTSTLEYERNQAGSAGYNNTVRFRLNIPF